MKYKLSISVDEDTVFLIQDMMRTRKFKNKSHVVENAVKKFYEGAELVKKEKIIDY